jgi:hypothetical protein
MNKLSKTILIATIAVFGATLLLVPSAKAVSPLYVDFEDTPLFNEADFKPGDSVIRWVRVTNNSGETKPIATEAINYPGFPDPNNVPLDDLSRALLIVIREEGGSDLYGGSGGEKTLFDFYQDGETYLSDVGNSNTQGYEYEISFPSEKENEWQTKTTTFDIIIGFQGTEGGGDSDGGGISGGGWLGLTILDESIRFINPCETSITILWTTSYASTSQVVYSTSGQSHTLDLGAINYGYANSKEGDDSGIEKVDDHSVSLAGLVPETTYFYRCVSHASPPTVSLQYAFTTPPMGTCFPLPEVRGEATTGGEVAGAETEEEGMVLGEETAPGNLLATVAPFFESANFCWLFLILIIILICLYLLSFKKIKSKKKKWFYFLGILILIILYCYFCCTICWLLLLLALLIIALVYLLRKKTPSKPPEMPQPPEMPGIQQ